MYIKKYRKTMVLLILLCVFFPISGIFAKRNATYEQLKKQDIERAMKYEMLKKNKEPCQIKHVLPQTLFIDTDDDGMPDLWEADNGLDPNDPDDAWFDPDGDEVVNLFEYQLGSNLYDPESPQVTTVAQSGADYTDVETAIDAVSPGTAIRIAGGSYNVNYITFSTKVVMIQGGLSSDFSQRDLKLYPTIFDGGMQDEVIYFSVSSGEAVIILDGINFIRGNGYFGAVNLLAQGSSFMKTSIFNCFISESESGASYGGVLRINNWDTSQSDRTIANTVIGGNDGSGIRSHITDTTIAHWRIINTTISHNFNASGDNGYGIEAFTLDSGVLTTHIYNSIIWGNEQNDIEIHGWDNGGITFEVDHSDIGNVHLLGNANYVPSAGVVNVDPLFVDPANDDFHLQFSSPVVDTGINEGIPLIDFEGEPRISGVTVDMGADEYKGEGIAVLPTMAVSPSPFVQSRGHTVMTFFGAKVADSKIKIFNKAGEHIKTLKVPEEEDTIIWDGKSKDGKNAASGVYIWVLTTPSGEQYRDKFAIIK